MTKHVQREDSVDVEPKGKRRDENDVLLVFRKTPKCTHAHLVLPRKSRRWGGKRDESD